MTINTVDSSTRPVDPNCGVCEGTGFDPVFESNCSECFGHVAGRGGMTETLAARRTGTGPSAGTPAPKADDSWKRQVRWTKEGDTFFVVIPRGYGKVNEGDVVTVTSRNGEKSVTLGECYAPNRYGDLLYWPAADRRPVVTVTDNTPAPAARPNKFAGCCVHCGDEVDAGAGTLTKSDTGRWLVAHRDGECTAADDGAVPAGHYAIASQGDNDLFFLRVDRNEGYPVRIKMIVGGHPDMVIDRKRHAGIFARIVEAGVAESAALYGRKLERCCRCNRTLTDKLSRELGIGPECRNK